MHLKCYIEVNPSLRELRFDLISLMEMTQMDTILDITKVFLSSVFVLVYYQLILHVTIMFSSVHVG